MTNPFYNRDELRVRSFWRLLIQAVLLFLGSLVAGIALSLIVFAFLSASGTLPPDMVQNPEAVSALITQTIYGSPLIRLVTGLLNGLLIAGAVFLAGLTLDHRPWRDFGFHVDRAWWRDLAFGLFLGAFLMMLIFGTELAAGWIQITGMVQASGGVDFVPGVLIALVSFLFVGFYEELFSRGYQLHNLAEGLNWRIIGPRGAILLAYLLSSLVFGALHLGNPNATPLTLVQLGLAGLFLGLGYILTGELAISIGIHITWNFFQGNVFGFPVSGTNAGATFIGIHQGGPLFWTGGAWGPEGGLAGILALALGAALIMWWVRMTRGEIRLQECLAIYHPRQAQESTETHETLRDAAERSEMSDLREP